MVMPEAHLWRKFPSRMFNVELHTYSMERDVRPIYALGRQEPVTYNVGPYKVSGSFRALQNIDSDPTASELFELIIFEDERGTRTDLKDVYLVDDQGYEVSSCPIRAGQTVYFKSASLRSKES